MDDAPAVHQTFDLVAGGVKPFSDLLIGEKDRPTRNQRVTQRVQHLDGVRHVVQCLEHQDEIERPGVGNGCGVAHFEPW